MNKKKARILRVFLKLDLILAFVRNSKILIAFGIPIFKGVSRPGDPLILPTRIAPGCTGL